MKRRCTGRNQRGDPCRAWPLKDGALCFLHDPACKAEAAEARRHGGLRRRREGTLTAAYDLGAIDTVDGQRRLLEVVVADALAMDSGAPKLRILLDAIKTAMKLRESTEVEARISRLEAAGQQSRARPVGPADAGLLEDPGP